MKTRRLFIAIPVPQEIQKMIARKRDDLALSLKYIPESNYHLTVLFLGSFPEDEQEISSLANALEKVAESFPPFSLKLKELGVKSSRLQHMIWVNFYPCLSYESLVTETARLLHFPLERKPVPHINLVRNKEKIRGTFPVPFTENMELPVSRMEIWESHLKSGGATYSGLQSFILKGK